MLIRLVVAYLVLVTAAGPGLCCCSLTHLFAARAAGQPTSDEPPPCCQHGTDTEHPQSQGGCPRQKSDPRKPGCPCRHDAPQPALADRSLELPDQHPSVQYLLVPHLGMTGDGHLNVKGAPALPGEAPPSRTAQDLLRLHHQLRC
jgi:hypothetical protein